MVGSTVHTFCIILGLLPCTLAAQHTPHPAPTLRVPWVFADHMVLQRDRPVPVFGTAAPGAVVRVTFSDTNVTANANRTGAWQAHLPAQRASKQGRTLHISTDTAAIVLQDVLVGEVWLCAGQSNMDLPLRRASGGAAAAAAAAEPSSLLRLCNRTGSPTGGSRRLDAQALANITPSTYYSGTWEVTSADSAAGFSAVGFYFGRRLADELGVPIGLMDLSVGGSTTEGWVPHPVLAADDDLAPLVEDYLTTHLSHPFIRERTTTHLGAWVDAGRPEPRPRHVFEPSFLFESGIEPLAPFGIRGVLWYQGESNAHLPRHADTLFRMMVDAWRAAWTQPDLPFYFVQLPAMGRATWPEFREVQAGWLDIPHTGMAVALDVGHPTDVHPTNKQPVGERLARLALARHHDRAIPSVGPTPRSVHPKVGRLEIVFDHAEGLAWAPGRDPTGFEVSGADQTFYPARAVLQGNRVTLSSPDVPHPLNARYAWAPVPEWSLINGAGLPAAPFRTR